MESCTLHIALITDETTDQSILARALSLAGYSVHCTKSGSETLELLATTKVHLIISELVLEDMTGFDFLERSSDTFGNIPILFISDALIRVGDNEIRTVGGHGLIHRPFKNSDLVQMIRAITQQPLGRKNEVE
jgi:DNA-binding response OmpR family regulator